MSLEHTSLPKFCVYIHCRADDGEPFYVGKGTLKRAHSRTGRSSWWKSIVAKHGRTVKIQKYFQDESEAFASEIEAIAILRDLGYELCNMTSGGDGASGAVRSEEFRQKLSARNLQRWGDPEYRGRMELLAKDRMNSPEAKAALAEQNRARWAKPGTRERMSSLPDAFVRKIHTLSLNGSSMKDLAVKFQCSQAAISRILSGTRRRDIWLEFHLEQ